VYVHLQLTRRSFVFYNVLRRRRRSPCPGSSTTAGRDPLCVYPVALFAASLIPRSHGTYDKLAFSLNSD
jgi:hypothetical protein